MSTYGDVHKYFLQFMLRNGFVPIAKAVEFCSNCSDEVNNLSAVKTLISEINQKISMQELKIVSAKCEVTGTDSLVLLNTANDDINKQQNSFPPIEIEYFQLLLKEILINEEHKLQNMACFNLCNSLTSNLRKDNAERLLDKWTREGYLVEKDSSIYLGPRCILEFAPYFRGHCTNYYTSCHLCSEPVFTGKTCLSCNNTMHNHCMEKYLAKQNKCPSCKTVWNEVNGHVQDERMQDDSSEDEVLASSSSSPSPRKNPRLITD